MSKAKRNPFHRGAVPGVVAIFFAILAGGGVCGAQQSPPQLAISAPPDGSVVHPGGTLSVTVTSPAGVIFSQVGVVGEDPLGLSDIATSVPATFSFALPTDVSCGKYMLTAHGTTASGQIAQSATILIAVERPDVPTSISPLLRAIGFEVQGEQSPILLVGTFSDGAVLDVTHSSYVVYSSSNTNVATVNSEGIVTSVAPGATSISVTYTLNNQSVSVDIPVTVPPPTLSPSATSLTFGSQDVGTSSSPQALTLTNMRPAPIKVLRLDPTGDFSQTSDCIPSSGLEPGASCTVQVTFTPTGTGPRPGSLKISNSFNSISAAIPLNATGIGRQNTVTSLTSSQNPSISGQSVILTAAVTQSSGSGTPTGTVTFNEGANTLGAVTLSSGTATLAASSFSVGSHSLTASYSGDSNFNGSSVGVTQQVTYGICALYDQTRSVNSGATFPIKLYLCDSSGNNLSSSAIVLHALQVTNISGFAGDPESPGNANPDNDFRFDSTLGPSGGYIFNLKTTGLATGTYSLTFTVTGDPVSHSVNFGVK